MARLGDYVEPEELEVADPVDMTDAEENVTLEMINIAEAAVREGKKEQ